MASAEQITSAGALRCADPGNPPRNRGGLDGYKQWLS
jgi:hypothetical protein